MSRSTVLGVRFAAKHPSHITCVCRLYGMVAWALVRDSGRDPSPRIPMGPRAWLEAFFYPVFVTFLVTLIRFGRISPYSRPVLAT